MDARTAVELLSWRRAVAELYAEVRALLPRDAPAAHHRWVEGRDALFRAHPQSPIPAHLRARYAGIPTWPYDPELRCTAPLEPIDDPEPWPVGTSGGGAIVFRRVGRVRLDVGDLDAFWLDAYGGGLFVPFRDATAGAETYGGGRYLLDTAKGADLGADGSGRLVLDLNFAYHPSCFHDPAWSCPLAPPGNRLDTAVRAGERASAWG